MTTKYTSFSCHVIRPTHLRLLVRFIAFEDTEMIPVDYHLVAEGLKIMLKNQCVMNAKTTRNVFLSTTNDEETVAKQVREHNHQRKKQCM